MKNSLDLILVAVGALFVEIGGIWMIKLSQRYPNPSYIKKLGTSACIAGILVLILSMVGLFVGAW
jgi:hypothetical protein